MDMFVVEFENYVQCQKVGIDEFEWMYNDNYVLYQEFVQLKVYGEMVFVVLCVYFVVGQQLVDDVFVVQCLFDVKCKVDVFESKFDDFDCVMLMLKQFVLQIWMEQDQKCMLMLKFMMIKIVLIFVWINVFVFYFEQFSIKCVVVFVNVMYDVVDEVICVQVDLNCQNVQEVVKFGQCLVILIDMFEYVQQQLFGVFDDIMQIIVDGCCQCEQDVLCLCQFEQDLII